ncbi:hypothetical protein MKZ20_21560 [Psychrobacillus sp. FSL K6-2684]|uniref:hypothetical protein n=1 Tax=unclassified Psychrobacillus TaxID=2636677 RepID=UPI0030FCD999
MNNLLKVLNLFFLIIVLTGCGVTDKDIDSKANQTVQVDVPVQWLYYNDEKYVFNRVIPKEEIDMSMVELTGLKTKLGDGVEHNQDIYLYKKDGSLFVISKEESVEQWANFTENKK